MKMHHITQEQVDQIVEKVRTVVETGDYAPEIMADIFKLSGVDGEKFLECKNHPAQTDQANFEMDPEQGIRFFDPFNFFTNGIYKTIDGWSLWTVDNLKEPWDYD